MSSAAAEFPPVADVPGRAPFPMPQAVPSRAARRLGRLTRAAVLLAVLVWAVTGLVQAASSGPPAPDPEVQVVSSSSLAWAAADVVVVGAGQTLWEIAGEVAPAQDRRETVEQIKRLNGLSSSLVQPGQRLTVPVG